MNFFTRGKHWQLFIALCGLPIVLQIFMLVSTFPHIASGNPGIDFGNIFIVLPIATFLFAITLFLWLYNVGTNLYSRLPEGIAMSLNLFRLCIFFPAVYISILSIAMFGLFKGLVVLASNGNPDPTALSTQTPLVSGIVVLIIPMHFFSMFAIIYSLHFVAKTLRSIELKREVFVNDYLGEFFLFWFFPIGIWILQPRINKIFSANKVQDISVV